jgi:zinc/manganese transport system substrate-binding protein
MNPFKIVSFALLALFVAGASPAAAKVSVVAANQDLAWVASAVGGNRVDVDYLAKSGEDPHRVDPRPSQVVKIANADAIVRIGMDLDIWFDSLIRASGNAKVVNGARGYIDASSGIHPLEIPTGKLDPSKGDIHIFGNPHYLFAPSNVRIVAKTIADGLIRIDRAGAATYEANYNALVNRLNQAIPVWKEKLSKDRGKSLVTYHKSLVYFLNDFGLREFGNVEPKPGLEPTPGHVNRLADDMKHDNVKVILAENFRRRRFSDLLAREAGATLVVIPGGIGAEKGADDYFSFMTMIVDRVAAAL